MQSCCAIRHLLLSGGGCLGGAHYSNAFVLFKKFQMDMKKLSPARIMKTLWHDRMTDFLDTVN